jgi:Prophage tail length tape measure protein
MSLFGGNNEDLTLTIKANDEASPKLSKLQSSVGQLTGAFVLGNIATDALRRATSVLTSAVTDSIKAYEESENVIAQTNAVLTSTGHAAGMSADELIKLSQAFQSQTTYSDEAVLSAENLLLTFTSIGKDVFPQTTQVVLDMSAALGQDLKSSAIQVGKALQDPTIGITALQRVGVNFTDAQKETINTLIKTNRALEAQKIILAELSREFGGSAVAAAKTFEGQLKQLENKANDVQETIGHGMVAALNGMLIAFNQTTSEMDHNIDAGKIVFETFRSITEFAAGAATALTLVAGEILRFGSYVFEVGNAVANFLDGGSRSFDGFRDSIDQAQITTVGFTEKLLEQNEYTSVSWNRITNDSKKYAAAGPAAYERTAAAAAEAKKKIDDVNNSIQSTVDKLNDLVEGRQQQVADSNQKIGEAYAAQEQNIVDLKKSLGQSTDDAERVRIQNEITREELALASKASLQATYLTDIVEARRRASETEFERQIEDIQRQDELNKKAYLKKTVSLLQELLAEKNKQQEIMNGEMRVTATAVAEGAKRSADVDANVARQIAAYAKVGAAAASAYTSSSGGFSIASFTTPKHEFGGIVNAPIGMPVPIIAHGQERIVPAGSSSGAGGNVSITINNPSVRSTEDVVRLRAEIESYFRSITQNYKYT